MVVDGWPPFMEFRNFQSVQDQYTVHSYVLYIDHSVLPIADLGLTVDIRLSMALNTDSALSVTSLGDVVLLGGVEL